MSQVKAAKSFVKIDTGDDDDIDSEDYLSASEYPSDGDELDEADDEVNFEEGEEEAPGDEQNAGWADAISKVLGTKNKILSKAKKDRDITISEPVANKPKPVSDFEVVDEHSSLVQRLVEETTTTKSSIKKALIVPKTAQQVHAEEKRKEWENLGRKKLNVQDKDKETTLNSMATKGVVQLFNALKQQQQKIEEQLEAAGPSERKKDKAMAKFTKGNFLDTLKDNEMSPDEEDEEPVKSKPSKRKNAKDKPKDGKGWKVLREDFLGDAKMKDWDKEASDDGEESG